MANTDKTHHVVVALQALFCPVPELELPAPHTYELRSYEKTPFDLVKERIRDADVVITTTAPITAEALSPDASPHLKMIAVVASGTDIVHLPSCHARGIVVGNTPHCNATAVAEHTVALYFAARRSITLSHSLTQSGEWYRNGAVFKALSGPNDKPPRTRSSEVFGIFGYGAVGKQLQLVAEGLGMKTLIAGRKAGASVEGRVPFERVIREASVIALCLPRGPDTLNLISTTEFTAMRPDALVINVSRGGIVDEVALVAALRERRIAGAATDVYVHEPASPEDSPLLGPDVADLNLITTPHTAWVAEDTQDNYQRALKDNIHGWLTTGQPKYPVV
jgi:phosphoglycerate dehydrogenase-like enzyme